MFLQGAPSIISAMQKSLAGSDFANFSIQAHSLKPQAEFMGLSELKGVLVQLEEQSKSDHPDTVQLQRALDQVKQMFEQARPVLEQKVAELG